MAEPPFLLEQQADELSDRLALVRRDWGDVLLLGSIDRVAGALGLPDDARITVVRRGPPPPARMRWIDAGEADVDPGARAYDLVIAGGAIDSVNDLPGMLALARRALRPDSLFLGCLAGAGSLAAFRRLLIETESATGAARPHVHPQVDARQGGDLLARAGFQLPVADLQTLALSYADPMRLVRDLRAAGLTNALAGARSPIARSVWQELRARWAGADGRRAEQIAWLMLTGWSPPRPDNPPADR